jgi:hypothetical protein
MYPLNAYAYCTFMVDIDRSLIFHITIFLTLIRAFYKTSTVNCSHEWWDAVWPSKICAAEEWLRLESEVRKITRGEGKRTQEKFEAAIELATAGYSRTYIIESLQIQSATI